MSNVNSPASPPTGTTSPESGATGNAQLPPKAVSAPVKPTTVVSRPVSPTILGAASTGFGTVAAGLGLGNGATWNMPAALLGQGNNRAILPPTGNENLQGDENAGAGYRTGMRM
jgi:hypothetical protein